MQNEQLSPKTSQNNTKCYSPLPLKKCCTRSLIKFHTSHPRVMPFKPCFSLCCFFFPSIAWETFFKSSK